MVFVFLFMEATFTITFFSDTFKQATVTNRQCNLITFIMTINASHSSFEERKVDKGNNSCSYCREQWF